MKFLALGGNLGPVLDTFGWALQRLDANGVHPAARSGAYRTEAATWPGSVSVLPPYWNAVCQVQTALTSHAALELCKLLERQAGRVAGPQWGARPLDIDLLLWDEEVRATERLTLPHPRLHERLFVLRPLHELAPNLVIPTLRMSVRTLLDGFADGWSGIMLRRAAWPPTLEQKNTLDSGLKVVSQVIAPQDNCVISGGDAARLSVDKTRLGS